MGERQTPDAPHPGRRRRLRAPSCRPQSARCGVGGGSPCPHPPHPQPVGSGPWPHAQKHEWSGVGERPTPGAPHPGKRRPPLAPSSHPYSAPSQRARPARKSARGGVGDGSPRPQPPHGERAAPSQVRGKETGPPPPKQAKRSTGPRPDTRRGTDRVERPYQRPAPGPREVRAPHQPGEGGGPGSRESASTHTHKGHAGETRRATGPSPRNAQTAWNGVSASEDKGHTDGTARHTQRRKGGAGRGKQGGHNTRHRCQPPQTGRERRTLTTRALHLPRH